MSLPNFELDFLNNHASLGPQSMPKLLMLETVHCCWPMFEDVIRMVFKVKM